MPEQLAGDLAWLGGGLLFAWLVCAFAQLSAFAPAWALRAPQRAKPRCKRVREVKPRSRIALAISFALLVTVPPGLLAALVAHVPDALAAAECGALAGLWLGARHDLAKRARAMAAAGCMVGAASICVAFASFLLLPELPASGRAALYITATLGAVLSGAAANALICGARASERSRLPFRQGDRVIHAIAFALFAILGYGFAAMRMASAEFGLSVLVAACVLAAALGVRLMGGARRPAAPRPGTVLASAGAQASVPSQIASRPPARAHFVGVPGQWLVAAGGRDAFESASLDMWLADCDPPCEAPRASHHASQDLPRRRRNRSRHGALRQRQGPH
ncbi:hypothetical protein ACFSHT_02600 [Paraburkholderia silviterrae]|uniref:Uncharacterized protein n=1 Tax=Paraburkholderia silviterrae TaxID=2528715 RepID=A0A4V2ZZT7_9BURK|nr:hypothetical protein [Paraburkholderia silviterrae]TDG26474.1 hypothetical protein EYW47_03795 [Paraburkholderia silviterrae]